MAHTAYIGESFADRLSDIVATHDPRRIFLVTGKESFARSGAKDICDALFGGRDVVSFTDFSANPKIEDIEKGLALFRTHQPDMVVAIGGGSSIDIAKAVNILGVHTGTARSYIEGTSPLTLRGAVFVAVPTTAGTGSEATHFAALYVDGKKYSLAHEHMLPDYAIVDATLTHSLSPRQTALSGIDALCQAFESMWSIHSTLASSADAAEAARLIVANIKAAVQSPTSEAREAMTRAAHLAGKAINISKTTACHAMSYALTIQYDIPHGQAVGITFPELLVFNNAVTDADAVDPRGVAHVQVVVSQILGILGVRSAEEGGEIFRALMKDIGLSTHLSELGVKKEDIDALVGEMSIERAGNNPRKFTTEDARRVLDAIF